MFRLAIKLAIKLAKTMCCNLKRDSLGGFPYFIIVFLISKYPIEEEDHCC